jgi:quercetin dioxygenase-like cupin family protein
MLSAGKEVTMSRKVIMFSSIFAMGIAIGLIVNQGLNAQQQAVKSAVLLKADLVGMEEKGGFIVSSEVAPGEVGKKHYHPGHQFGYVLEGSMIMEIEGKPPITYKPGDTFYLTPNQVHDAKNVSTTAPVKVLGFSIAEKGQPLAVPVK